MNNAVVVGAYNGTNGGADQEGDYGFLLEADHGVTFTHLNVNDIQGDFINLNAPDTGNTGNDTRSTRTSPSRARASPTPASTG